MLQLLMIQPENRKINLFRRMQFNNFSQITIPYLAAFVDERYYNITLVDEYNGRIPFHKPFDLVAITVNTPNAPHCYEICARFHANGAKVVMGGPHVTLLPEEAAQHCDYLMIGEGEKIWLQFLTDFRNGDPHKIYRSLAPPALENLPVPRWDLVRRNRMMKGAVFATRGCHYHCRYCNLKQIYHDCYRTRPVCDVMKEIQVMPSKYFVFWDDNLFADQHYVKALLNAIKPLKRKWAAQVTLRDCADEELLKLAKSAGCQYLFIGLESFSNQSLIDAGKEINRVEDYKPLIDAIHRNGMMVQAGIVFGFDSDTKDVFTHTLSACEALGIDGATVSILTPFPKTPIYEQFEKEGRLLCKDWGCYDSKTAVAYQPNNMTVKELIDGYVQFRQQFYSFGSFIRRMRVSRTNVALNFVINLGYKLGIKKSKKNFTFVSNV